MNFSPGYKKTPVIDLPLPEAREAGVKILVRLEYLNHPHVSGNKWWKLKYNLEEAARQKKTTLLTFGGAYSNHIYATAAAAKECGFRSVGVIRGEETLPLNPTLAFAKSRGMELHYVSREAYRSKNDPQFISDLHQRVGEFYLIPEGGTNALAVKGTMEWAENLVREVEFDDVCLPAGTGGTLAGMLAGMKGEKNIIGVSVLKNGEFLEEEVKKLTEKYVGRVYGNLEVLTSYHHGGYAKVTDELKKFIVHMNEVYSLPLDPVYTGKLMWAVREEVRRGKFRKGSTVLVLHTGGLQGATYTEPI